MGFPSHGRRRSRLRFDRSSGRVGERNSRLMEDEGVDQDLIV